MSGVQILQPGVQRIQIKSMKNLIGFILVFLSFTGFTQESASQKAYIEITGTAETEVVPDEITLRITLLERMDGKEKITIEKQENELKKQLKELAIDLSNLSLNDAAADYKSVRKKTKDVLVSKSYNLKLNSTGQLAKVYEKLDKIDAYDAFILKFSYSKIIELQKENRIKAIKAAREKAVYVLGAIDQACGATLQVLESENYVEGENNMYAQPRSMKLMANSMESYTSDASESIEFKKIKVRNSFIARFEIVKK